MVLLMLTTLVVVGVTVEVGIVMLDEEGIPSIGVVLDEMFFSVITLLLVVVQALVASVGRLVLSSMPSMLV